MGHRDKDGKRLKWTGAEKRMVKALKAQGLKPETSVLALRGRARELGKYAAVPSSFDQRPNHPFHLAYPAYPAYSVYPGYQTEQFYPLPPFQPEFFPVANDEGPSRSSRAWTRATPTVNSVVVVPGHDERGVSEGQRDDVSFHAAITPNLPVEDGIPSAEDTEANNVDDTKQSSDETASDDGSESNGFDPECDYDGDFDVEMSDPAEAKIDELMVLDELDLDEEEDDTDVMLQEIYLEMYRPIFPIANLAMEIIFEIGRHLSEKEFVRFLVTDKTIAGHPVVRLRLLQLRWKRRILRWTIGQWEYWRRWQLPRELATNMEEEDRLDRAVLHYRKFNERVPIEKMRIVECAQVWNVLTSDLRDEINWQDQATDSDYDDIMQQ